MVARNLNEKICSGDVAMVVKPLRGANGHYRRLQSFFYLHVFDEITAKEMFETLGC